MYDELVKRLRQDAPTALVNCDFDFVVGWIEEAADAIEELQADRAALNGTVANLLEQIKDLSKPRWISVSERMPEANEEVLIYLWDRPSPYIAWIDQEGRWETNDFYVGIENTPKAWMPLPKPYKPPKEE